MERLNKVFQLPPGERVILVQAWALFFLVDLGLRVLPFKHLLAFSQKMCLTRQNKRALVHLPSLPRLLWLVEVAGRYAPVNTTCLKKALVLSRILTRRGIATTFRIGVARHEGTLVTAHAWLERQGEVIPSFPACDRYEPLVPAR
ncbi:MAG: lasso peptide biosynthesis B2 protein [Anaerolineae bacterium]